MKHPRPRTHEQNHLGGLASEANWFIPFLFIIVFILFESPRIWVVRPDRLQRGQAKQLGAE